MNEISTGESRKRPREADPKEGDEGDTPMITEGSLQVPRYCCSTDARELQRNDQNKLPPELVSVDFSKRIHWNKYAPYAPDENKLSLVEPDTNPVFNRDDSPALCHHVNALSGRARACTIHLKPQKGQTTTRPIPTPMFMPVGTKGCLKGLTLEELTSDEALACPIILGNTYHLAIQPGTELIDEMDGLHTFQGVDKLLSRPENANNFSYNLLTDSGGFQMVSLVKLSQVTEEGVSFENPFKKTTTKDWTCSSNVDKTTVSDGESETDNNKKVSASSNNNNDPDMLLLRPEDSIRHQNNISANIIMALDDVVSSVVVDDERFRTATYRTLRWYDRCIQAHAKAATQNLFPIVQGGLDTGLGGLREQCLAGFRHRQLTLQYAIPGYAIGGLAGGEEKDQFWKVVDQCCRALPDDKPRYLMGVGYPLDLVVCTALGVDLYDCVYPTRTARFGVALVSGPSPGTIKLKAHGCLSDTRIILEGCRCQACREGISRARLHMLFKASNPLAVELITQHNIAYMMSLVQTMRTAILEDRFAEYVTKFIQEMFVGKEKGGEDVPSWVVDALASANIHVGKEEEKGVVESEE